jgi:hypothetical protein
MDRLKLDIYEYFLPMSSDAQTAASVTHALMEIITNHLSEYISDMEHSLMAITELQRANAILQNRKQEAEEAFINGMRLAHEMVLAIGEQQRGEQHLDDLEKLQKEL